MKTVMLALAILLSFSLKALDSKDGKMTPEDKDFLLNYLDETGHYFINMLNDVDAALWKAPSSVDEKWSIRNCAEHILTSEQAILKRIQDTMKENAPTTDKTSTLDDESVLNILHDRIAKRSKTVEALVPTGQWIAKQDYIDAFWENRQVIKEFVNQCDQPLRHYFVGTPAGEIDLYQYLLLLPAHTARHTMQIEAIKNELGLSTAQVNFGGNVKVNCPADQRGQVKELFASVMHLEVEEKEQFDKVLFDGGGFVVFFYQEDASNLLSEKDYLNSMQAALQIPAHQFESIKRRLKAFGVKEVYPNTEKSKTAQAKYFYFHAPGGQVFRLVKMKDTPTMG